MFNLKASNSHTLNKKHNRCFHALGKHNMNNCQSHAKDLDYQVSSYPLHNVNKSFNPTETLSQAPKNCTIIMVSSPSQATILNSVCTAYTPCY